MSQQQALIMSDYPANLRAVSASWYRPGVSGNPGGRPRKLPEVTKLARDGTAEAIEALRKIVTSKRSSASEKIAAAQVVLAYGWGRAPRGDEAWFLATAGVVATAGRPPDPEQEETRRRTREWLMKRLADLAKPEPLLVVEQEQPQKPTTLLRPPNDWP
jgi:hypothetical protein